MKKGKNVMKNKKATNKNIQKKAMRDKKKKPLARSKKAAVDLKKKAPQRQKDEKNLKRAAAGDPERKKRGPKTLFLKGSLLPDVWLAPPDGYFTPFKLTCMIIPPLSSSSDKKISLAVGVGPEELPTHMVERPGPRTPMLRGPLMPDTSLTPEEDYFKRFELACMVIPPKKEGAANRIVVGVAFLVEDSE